jgi:hypothetical protein
VRSTPKAEVITTLPPDPACLWTAEITWHQHGRAGTFAVVARASGAAAGVVVAASGPLEWPPTSAASVQALSVGTRELEDGLAAAGWRPLPPGSAWYAKRFAWEPVDPRVDGAVPTPADPAEPALVGEPANVGGPFARPPAWPAGARDLWRCEIGWDAGWAVSRFRAFAYAPRRRRGRSIGASTTLPWLLMGRPDPDSAAHCAALHDLEAELERAGWERLGQGADWYSTRMAWRHDQPPSERRDTARVGSAEDGCRETGAPDVYDRSERSLES